MGDIGRYEANTIVVGDCLEVMSNLPNGCVDLVVTSPPYFVKKHYEAEWTWEDFDVLMQAVMALVFDKLVAGGYMVLNFGDNAFGRDLCDTECISTYPMTHYYWSIKDKFELQATRIWRKVFARVPFNGQARFAPRNLFDYEHIWTFRKPDGYGKEVVRNIKLSCRGVLGDDWKSSALDNHCAAFPVELPEWAIRVYSDVGDLVFDPFMGSGTTAVAADRLDRRFFGCDISEEYVGLAENRLAGDRLERSQLEMPI